jgi:putative oxidoreductase
MIEFMMSDYPLAKDIGLLIIRLGVGFIFIRHGYDKIIGGYKEWVWLGNQMANIGITFFPLFWGLCSTATEFLGGIALILGFDLRIACIFLTFNMFVAIIHHIKKGDSFSYISHPLSLFFVFLGLMIAGGGYFSMDAFLSR